MTETIIVIALAAMVAVLAAALLRADRARRELVRLLGEANARIWNRLEWLCEDTDNRLSVDRVELQQRAMQIKNLQKRVKRVEGCLYLEARDAFKEED